MEMETQAQIQPQSQVQNTASNGQATPLVTSLYVGDLDVSITDPQLYEMFNQIGDVVSVRVCRDTATSRSLGYGYVNYANAQDAARALEELNFTPLNGKPIRIMYSNRDPAARRSVNGNIFIKNLDKDIDHKALHDTFSAFGSILSCKVATDASGQSLGYGFVQYASEESAKNAIEKLNGMLLNGMQVYVGPFVRKQERETPADRIAFTNVFVKNLSDSVIEDDLKNIFGEFGSITSTVVMRNADGTSRCFGFVNFENAEDAAKAVESLNGKMFDDKEWYVGRAQKKSEREQELKYQHDQAAKDAAERSQRSNLYVKNLDDSIDDDKLRELFSPFGSITSCKVMRDPKGISRGSGFVAFASPEEASKAIAEMNGRIAFNKPLYVAFAERKEDRVNRLQAQFSQMRPLAMIPTMGPHMPMFAPGAPALGQQLFYGQPPPAIIHAQNGFGYQQQLLPGMRQAGPLMPNMFMPIMQQGQQGPRLGGRRNHPGPTHQGPPSIPEMQRQMLPRGRGYRNPHGRAMPNISMQGGAGGMLSAPYDMGGLPSRDVGMSQPIPIGALASALANASPIEQRMMLGENLYPLVEQLEPQMAAKVTGMLLEMDQTEVLHLLESPEALKAKVNEAMEVLRSAASQETAGMSPTADRLASMSLNE